MVVKDTLLIYIKKTQHIENMEKKTTSSEQFRKSGFNKCFQELKNINKIGTIL